MPFCSDFAKLLDGKTQEHLQNWIIKLARIFEKPADQKIKKRAMTEDALALIRIGNSLCQVNIHSSCPFFLRLNNDAYF